MRASVTAGDQEDLSNAAAEFLATKSPALPAELRAARPKGLRFRVFTIVGRLLSHADKLVVRMSEAVERFAGLITARTRLPVLVCAHASG